MTIYLHDTLQGKKLPFKPLKKGRVTMYLCGPTVYNYAHIGNARPAVVFDLLTRVLRRKYKLIYARNITDVDDKINQAALDADVPIDQITTKYIKAYNEDMSVLGVKSPDIEPRATEHVKEMIEMIQLLLEKNHAYEAEGHVLFDVSSNPDYGILSKRDLREMIAGARVEVAPYKSSPQDFVLWKPSSREFPGWDSPWGRGRPGWHIECSAMSKKHLGNTIDIHAGGQDLIFPHHENEIAQSTCAHDGAPFARYWVHNGFLSVGSKKMSKSLGNVLLLHDLLKVTSGEVIRLALLSAHYRQPLEWSDQTLHAATRMLDRFYGAVRLIDLTKAERQEAEPPAAVIEALEDDINTPKALAAMFHLARTLNKTDDSVERKKLGASLLAGGDLMGLIQENPDKWFGDGADGGLSVENIEMMLTEREKARSNKNFSAADAIRDRLANCGIQIEDSVEGARWRRTE